MSQALKERYKFVPYAALFRAWRVSGGLALGVAPGATDHPLQGPEEFLVKGHGGKHQADNGDQLADPLLKDFLRPKGTEEVAGDGPESHYSCFRPMDESCANEQNGGDAVD